MKFISGQMIKGVAEESATLFCGKSLMACFHTACNYPNKETELA